MKYRKILFQILAKRFLMLRYMNKLVIKPKYFDVLSFDKELFKFCRNGLKHSKCIDKESYLTYMKFYKLNNKFYMESYLNKDISRSDKELSLLLLNSFLIDASSNPEEFNKLFRDYRFIYEGFSNNDSEFDKLKYIFDNSELFK